MNYQTSIILIFVNLIHLINWDQAHPLSKRTAVTCQTEECKFIGDMVTSAMNKSVDPCDDFWEHTCGRWISDTPIPPSEAVWNRFTMVLQKTRRRIREILESSVKPTDYDMLQKAKRWYRSCMNTDAREVVGIEPMKLIVENIGGWPATMSNEEWTAKNIYWLDIDLYYGNLTGRHAFWTIKSEKSVANLLRYRVTFAKAPLPLASKLIIERKNFDEADREAYVRLIKNVIQTFIGEKDLINENSILNDVRDMVAFEAQLSRIDRGHLYEVSLINHNSLELDLYFNSAENTLVKVNISRYIQQAYDFGNVTIHPNETVQVYSNYIIELAALLHNTSARTLANYVHWYFVSEFIDATNSKMSDFLLEFKQDAYGVQTSRPQWEQCVEAVKLNHAVGLEFVKGYFSERIKQEVADLVKSVQTVMEKEILLSDWLSNDEKNLTVRKLKNVVALIGYPEQYHNSTFLMTAYQSVNISDNYLDNAVDWSRFVAIGNAKILRRVDTRTAWSGSTLTVNPFYKRFLNSIVLPAATLQTPYFSPDLPQVVNLAMLGSIIGHELGHAFDPVAIFANENGTFQMPSTNLWRAYERHYTCFGQQYERYEGYQNGTLNEDVADNQGIRAAYDAYVSLLREANAPGTRVPGLEEYSNEQTFFILFGNMWCDKATPQYRRKMFVDETKSRHSLSRLRIIGSLSNFEQFARVFNCPKDSPMNPQNKCGLF